MKFSRQDYVEGYCTHEEYISQFDPISLKIGETYVQSKGTWHEAHYKIIFQDDRISLGVIVYSAIGDIAIGDYCLFWTNSGFKYNDNRIASYQLKELS